MPSYTLLKTTPEDRAITTSYTVLESHREMVAETAQKLGVVRSEVIRRAIEEFSRKNT